MRIKLKCMFHRMIRCTKHKHNNRHNAQAHQGMLESEHVEKICLGFVLFEKILKSRIWEWSHWKQKNLFVRFVCVCVQSAEHIPYAINEIREWCDFLFVSFDVCCQFLSQFFSVNGKMRLKSHRPYAIYMYTWKEKEGEFVVITNIWSL